MVPSKNECDAQRGTLRLNMNESCVSHFVANQTWKAMLTRQRPKRKCALVSSIFMVYAKGKIHKPNTDHQKRPKNDPP